MIRRNFLKALGATLLAPLIAFLPKRQELDRLVIDWRDSIRQPAPEIGEFDVVSFDANGFTLRVSGHDGIVYIGGDFTDA